MKVKIQPPTDNHTGVFIDGVELPNVGEVTVRHPVGGPPVVTMDVIALDGLDIELDAKVGVSFHTYPGHTMEMQPLENGNTRVVAKYESGEAEES